MITIAIICVVTGFVVGVRAMVARRCVASHEPRALRLVDARLLDDGSARRVMSPKARSGLESLLACAASSPERVAVCRHGETLTLQQIRVAIADGDRCACCREPVKMPSPTTLPGPGMRRSG